LGEGLELGIRGDGKVDLGKVNLRRHVKSVILFVVKIIQKCVMVSELIKSHLIVAREVMLTLVIGKFIFFDDARLSEECLLALRLFLSDKDRGKSFWLF